jgi:hypothetical protein
MTNCKLIKLPCAGCHLMLVLRIMMGLVADWRTFSWSTAAAASVTRTTTCAAASARSPALRAMSATSPPTSS